MYQDQKSHCFIFKLLLDNKNLTKYIHVHNYKISFLLLSLKYFLNTKLNLIMERSKLCNLEKNNIQNL